MTLVPEPRRRARARRRLPTLLGLLLAAAFTVAGVTSPALAQPQDDDYASWDDVVAAQHDVARQEQLIAEIQVQIQQLNTRLAGRSDAAAAAGEVYAAAAEAAGDKAGEVALLEQQAADASTLAEQSKEQAGRLAAAMANRGGGSPGLTVFMSADNADTMLDQLGTLSRLAEQANESYVRALADRNTAIALRDQADAELVELRVLETEAKAAFDSAQAEQIQALLDRNAAANKRAELMAMLVPLQEKREVVAADYEAGERIRAEQAQAEAAERARLAAQAQEEAYQQALRQAEAAGVQPPAKPAPAADAPPAAVPVDPPVKPDGTLADGDPQQLLPAPTPVVPTPVAPAPGQDGASEDETPAHVEPAEDTTNPDIELVPEPEPGPAIVPGYAAPMHDAVVTDEFGMRWHPVYGDYRMHNGLDLGVPGGTCGAPLYAVSSGTVTYAGPNGGYGNHVVLDIGGGVVVSYSHIMEDGINTWVGQEVEAGALLAYAGTTGTSTGCHLHFELSYYDQLMDPKPWLADLGIPYV